MIKKYQKINLNYKLHIFNISKNYFCSKNDSSTLKTISDEAKKKHTFQSLSKTQRILLGIGTSAMALIDPYRDDMVAVSSEMTSSYILQKLYNSIYSSDEGRQVLKDKPIINSINLDLNKLEQMPDNTLGYNYVKFLKDNNISCDTRKPVKYIDNIEHSYILQRYREIHDIVHLLCYMKTNMLGEVVVKWIEAIQTDLPMCKGAAILGSYRLYPKQRELYKKVYLDWAIKCGIEAKPLINFYYEKRWNQDINNLRSETKYSEIAGNKINS